jgi:hypothetical protein
VLQSLSDEATQALTDAQLNSMSKEQLTELLQNTQITADQTATVTARLKKLG